MPAITPATFQRLLRPLDGAALSALVADLWAARGWETAVDGATVVATDPARDRRVVVRCRPASRGWRSGEPPAADETDVVVSARELPAGRDDPTTDVRVIGPAALREMLLYAVDRETADRLARDHLGRSLVADASSPSLRERLSAATGRRRLVGGLLVALALGLVVAATGGPAGLVDASQLGPAGPTPTSVPVTDAPSVGDVDPAPGGGDRLRYPPGLGASGVTDAAALAAAHRQAAADRRWDLLLVHRGSKDLLDPDRRWVGSRQTVDRLNASRYWYRVSGLERLGSDSFRSTVYDDYGDGNANFRRVAGGAEPSYRRTRLPDGGEAGVFAAVSAAYVRRYLDTTESRVELVDIGDTHRYRVVATGTPRGLFVPVADYTAVAVVDRRGLVRHLTVTFTRLDRKHAPAPTATPPSGSGTSRARDDPPGRVRFELVFRDVGDATVSVPAWYDEARNATDGTAVEPWPNDPAV